MCKMQTVTEGNGTPNLIPSISGVTTSGGCLERLKVSLAILKAPTCM
jgi:hypothetical protein